jgi:hypothetical protein
LRELARCERCGRCVWSAPESRALSAFSAIVGLWLTILPSKLKLRRVCCGLAIVCLSSQVSRESLHLTWNCLGLVQRVLHRCMWGSESGVLWAGCVLCWVGVICRGDPSVPSSCLLNTRDCIRPACHCWCAVMPGVLLVHCCEPLLLWMCHVLLLQLTWLLRLRLRCLCRLRLCSFVV